MKDLELYLSEPSKFIGTLWEWGSEPSIVESDEQTEEFAEIIANGTITDVLTESDGEEFEIEMKRLDLSSENKPTRIFCFVNGNEGSFCLPSDWE